MNIFMSCYISNFEKKVFCLEKKASFESGKIGGGARTHTLNEEMDRWEIITTPAECLPQNQCKKKPRFRSCSPMSSSPPTVTVRRRRIRQATHPLSSIGRERETSTDGLGETEEGSMLQVKGWVSPAIANR